jgi:predicted AlkP superfamily pyrophosphatase or phosphodiesterase
VGRILVKTEEVKQRLERGKWKATFWFLEGEGVSKNFMSLDKAKRWIDGKVKSNVQFPDEFWKDHSPFEHLNRVYGVHSYWDEFPFGEVTPVI